MSDSVFDGDGDKLDYKLNFDEEFFVEGTERGKFGWEVKSFDSNTGMLTLQVYTEKNEAWHYDGADASNAFVRALEGKGDTEGWMEGSAYQPFNFTVYDEDGHALDCNFKLQVFDYDYNSPIALDLNDDGEIGVTGEHTARDSERETIGDTVDFDIDGDGLMDQIEWFAGDGDGILVDLAEIDGSNIDGNALFGDQGGQYDNGYEKLSERDANRDGTIDGDELDGLGLWVDDGDAILEDGELRSIDEYDIESISTEMELDEEGRMRSTATTTDGDEILSEDVWFASAELDDDDDDDI